MKRGSAFQKYHKLVNLLLDMKEFGHWDEEKSMIALYDVENKKHVLDKIKNDIESVTKKYNFVVLDKNEPYTNINILDIEI